MERSIAFGALRFERLSVRRDPERGEDEEVHREESERRGWRRGVDVPAELNPEHEEEAHGRPQARAPEQERERVEVPRVELVVQRPRAEDADKVGLEEGERDEARRERERRGSVRRRSPRRHPPAQAANAAQGSAPALVRKDGEEHEVHTEEHGRRSAVEKHLLRQKLEIDTPEVYEAAPKVEGAHEVLARSVREKRRAHQYLRQNAKANPCEGAVPSRPHQHERHSRGREEEHIHLHRTSEAEHQNRSARHVRLHQRHRYVREKHCKAIVEEAEDKYGVQPLRNA
mmetsp:Transcript_4174/g.14558  ORF Transcript_4174/g.14558 Transcript_4174/m.14558 type:complete len:286 (+) Transcript_4174:54-911(+)